MTWDDILVVVREFDLIGTHISRACPPIDWSFESIIGVARAFGVPALGHEKPLVAVVGVVG